MQPDQSTPSVREKRWTIAKYEGDPPRAGETKEPFEIIEGGDDIPTRVIFRRPGADPASYATDLPYQPEIQSC